MANSGPVRANSKQINKRLTLLTIQATQTITLTSSHSPHLSVTQPFTHPTCHSPSLSVAKPCGHLTFRSLNLLLSKPRPRFPKISLSPGQWIDVVLQTSLSTTFYLYNTYIVSQPLTKTISHSPDLLFNPSLSFTQTLFYQTTCNINHWLHNRANWRLLRI